MPELSLVCFDDDRARAWEPFALTRPAGELLFGTMTLRARAERVFGARCIGHLAAEHLAGWEEEGAPAVVGEAPDAERGARLFLSSRAVAEWSAAEAWAGRGGAAGPIEIGGEVVGWFAPAGAPAPDAPFFHDPAASPLPAGAASPLRLPGTVLQRVWELVPANPDRVGADIRQLFRDAPAPALPAGVHRIGDGAIVLGEGAEIEPGVVLDTRGGPICLAAGARVRAFTRLAGPAYIGPRSVVLGGPVEAVSVGPVCKVRGELAESVCLGYTNKQHDGHMGHAYLGRWVNLGAETTNSDLKNNYGTIRMWTPSGDEDTGVIKMGCLLGDHVKTGIGLLLNTGTVVGAGSNLFGAAMPPKWVPPFSWGTGEDLTEFRLDKFLEVAERAMGRRDVSLAPPMREVLERAWTRGRGQA